MKPNPKSVRNKRISNARQRKQQHLLDVKVRASTERSRRAQAVCSFIFKTILILGLIAGVYIGGKEALRRFLWENPDYSLHEISFATDGALTRQQVLAAAQITEGRNIFTVDLGRTRAAIEKLPQVENATVQRILPNRIVISLAERRPVAWVAPRGVEDPSTSDRSLLVDAGGVILRSRVLLREYYHLPIITGCETENLVPGKKVNDPEMLASLELIRLSADNTRFQIQSIDVSKGYCLVATDQRHARITFGLDDIDGQVSRLYRCFDRATQDHKQLQTVNLVVSRNVPVTFFEPEAETAPAAEAVPKAKPVATPEEKPAVKLKGKKGAAANLKSSATAPPVWPIPAPINHSDTPRGGGAEPAPAAPTPAGSQSFKKPFRLNP